MAERAVFLSRTAAHYAIIKQGRINGVPDMEIALKGKTYPKYVKGQMIGWEAFVPAYAEATFCSPIYEE